MRTTRGDVPLKGHRKTIPLVKVHVSLLMRLQVTAPSKGAQTFLNQGVPAAFALIGRLEFPSIHRKFCFAYLFRSRSR